MRAAILTIGLLASCGGERITIPPVHFDPASGTEINDVDPLVNVINLEDEDYVCYTTDGSDATWSSDCSGKLDGDRSIGLVCGFNVVNIAWSEGTDNANYLVQHDDCDESGPVILWSNDELVRAFAPMQDEVRCRMNDCKNPSGTGNWNTTCDEGRVDWKVSLNGLRAISEFTYSGCKATASIAVHDYETDPDWVDDDASIDLDVTLVLDGTIRQDTDFSGNGNEAGELDISGDFTGKIKSRIQIKNKARGGGGFAGGCSADPLDDEICAPGNAMILYDFPDWACHGAICPKPGDQIKDGPDSDEDGVVDEDDNCPDVANPLQEDIDEDGIGDACDDEAGFVLLQFKSGKRCIDVGVDGVESTSNCDSMDPSQRWVMLDHGGFAGFKNVESGRCMGQDATTLIGPWTVTTDGCDPANAEQQWKIEPYDQGGHDAKWPIRLHNQAADFCAWTDFTGKVWGTIANCGLAGSDGGRKIGIYAGGDFESDPLVP